jgi:peptidoglycan-N-acetylglucosamine deacetylase
MFNSPIILGAAGALALSAPIVSHGLFAPSSCVWGKVISCGTAQGPPRVALTFDDGPTPVGTDRVLDLLAELKVSATFFVIGRNVECCPDLLRRIDAEGHLIANHTFDHSHWGIFGHARWWQDQILRTDDAIERVIGRRPAMFRPPIGHKTPSTLLAVRRTGHALVTWNVRSFDAMARATPTRILDRLMPQCGAGDIVLLHDGVEPHRKRDPSATVQAVRPLITGLREQGIQPVRLDELTGLPAYQK